MTRLVKLINCSKLLYRDEIIAEFSTDYIKLYPHNYDKSDRSFCALITFFLENDKFLYGKLKTSGDIYVYHSLKGNNTIAFKKETEGSIQIYCARW